MQRLALLLTTSHRRWYYYTYSSNIHYDVPCRVFSSCVISPLQSGRKLSKPVSCTSLVIIRWRLSIQRFCLSFCFRTLLTKIRYFKAIYSSIYVQYFCHHQQYFCLLNGFDTIVVNKCLLSVLHVTAPGQPLVTPPWAKISSLSSRTFI